MAPEIIQGRTYGHAIDIWSLGIVIYEMLVGMTPFWGKSMSKMCHNIIYSPPDLSCQNLSNAARSLCLRLLDKDQNQRPTIAEIKNQSFFDGINWEKLAAKQVVSPFRPQSVRFPFINI